MLLLGKAVWEVLKARNTNLLVATLWFCYQSEKSVLIPTQKIKFLGLIIDSIDLSLTTEKSSSYVLGDVQGTISINFRTDKTNWSNWSKFNLGTCSSCRFNTLSVINNPECQVYAGTKLVFKINKKNKTNRKYLIQSPPQMMIQADASLTDGSSLQGKNDKRDLVHQGSEITHQYFGVVDNEA